MDKKVVSGIMLTLLVACLLALTFEAQPVEAIGTIYIRADGSIHQPTAPIQRDGDVYTFTDNIYNCLIVVERSHIVIDGNGYTLQGTGGGKSFFLSGINNVTVKNTNIEGFGTGVWLSSSSCNTLSRNNITNNLYGIDILSGNSNIITGNYITNNDYGIWLDGSSYNTISGNDIETYGSHSKGIKLGHSSYNTVSGNNITNNRSGIDLWHSSNNNVSGNYITNNVRAVDLWWSSSNTVSGNKITNNDYSGVFLGSSSYNTVSGNDITNNDYGVEISYCSDNRFYHNNFLDNTQQVNIESSGYANFWDDDYPSGGNYWSDYTGADADRDGIGDAPYVIDDYNRDRYPLMNPRNQKHPPTAYIDDIHPNPATEGENVYFSGHGLDTDGYIVEYSWESSRDGFLSSSSSFSTSALSVGTHTIYFKVKDNDDAWSEPDTETLTIEGTQPSWTFMAYLDGDNNLEGEMIRSLNEMEKAGSSEEVNIVVLLDRHPKHDSSNDNWETTRLYYVTEDDDFSKINSQRLYDYGELNMGDDQTLTDFIEWTKQNYPAEHYCLVLADHGGGYRSLCEDDTDNDELDMSELKQALEDAEIDIDVLVFEACLMGMIEVAYQIKDCARTMVASEDLMRSFRDPLSFIFHLFPYDKILSRLRNNPSMTATELAQVFVEEFEEEYQYDFPFLATISALNLHPVSINRLASTIDEFASVLRSNLDSYEEAITQARGQTEEYFEREKWPPFRATKMGYIDLYHFVELVKQKIGDSSVRDSADDLMAAINSIVLDEWHQIGHPNSHGLSIYFPESRVDYHFSILYENLAFFKERFWDEFLDDYLRKRLCIVFSSSSSTSTGPFDSSINIDGSLYDTPKFVDVAWGNHEFLVTRVKFLPDEVVIFDHWEDEHSSVLSHSPLLTYNLDVDKVYKLWSIYKPLTLSTLLSLEELGSKLYLHVYDSEDRHVGFNTQTLEIEMEIPGSYCEDLGNMTLILLPRNTTSFKIVVDATFAHESVEEYQIALTTVTDGIIIDQVNTTNTIDKGAWQEFNAELSENGEIVAIPEFPLFIILPLLMTMTLIAVIFYRRKLPE